MIIGLGSDLIDIRRIERALERHGARFIDRIFTEVEKRKSANSALHHTQSALPQRKHAQKRWEQDFRAAFSGRTWALPIFRPASRQSC